MVLTDPSRWLSDATLDAAHVDLEHVDGVLMLDGTELSFVAPAAAVTDEHLIEPASDEVAGGMPHLVSKVTAGHEVLAGASCAEGATNHLGLCEDSFTKGELISELLLS